MYVKTEFTSLSYMHLSAQAPLCMVPSLHVSPSHCGGLRRSSYGTVQTIYVTVLHSLCCFRTRCILVVCLPLFCITETVLSVFRLHCKTTCGYQSYDDSTGSSVLKWKRQKFCTVWLMAICICVMLYRG